MKQYVTLVMFVFGMVSAALAIEPPTNLTAIGDGANEQVTLRWIRVVTPDADSFNVYRSDEVDGTYTYLTSTTDSFITLDALEEVEFFKVKADSNGVESEFNDYLFDFAAGYCRYDIPGSGTPGVQSLEPFGLPFVFFELTDGIPHSGYWTEKPSDIVHDQIAHGTLATADKVVIQNGGSYAYINNSGEWQGSLEDGAQMDAGHAFTFQNKSGSDETIILAGVNWEYGGASPITITAPVAPATSANTHYSWRDCRKRAMADLDLLSQGFTGGTNFTNSDRVVDQNGGTYAYYRTSSPVGWAGSLTNLTVFSAYTIENKHVGNTWSYEY